MARLHVRSMRKLTCALLLASLGGLFSVSGCGDDTEQEALAFTAGELCSAYFGVYDTLWDRCCSPGEATQIENRDDRVAKCTEKVGASLARGRSTTDRAAFQACIAGRKQRLMDASCMIVDDPEQAMVDVEGCSSMILGKGAVGAACETEDECQNGLTCILYSAPGKGYCVETPEFGRSCRQGYIEDGAVLTYTFGDHPLCAEGNTCVVDSNHSYSCLPPSHFTSSEKCTTNGFCGPGRYCSSIDDSVSRCKDAGSMSEEGSSCPCTTGFYCGCKSMSYCASSDPTTLGCRALVGEGSACASDDIYGTPQKGCKGECVNGVCQSYCSSG
jgi:hypothetical protein